MQGDEGLGVNPAVAPGKLKAPFAARALVEVGKLQAKSAGKYVII